MPANPDKLVDAVRAAMLDTLESPPFGPAEVNPWVARFKYYRATRQRWHIEEELHSVQLDEEATVDEEARQSNDARTPLHIGEPNDGRGSGQFRGRSLTTRRPAGQQSHSGEQRMRAQRGATHKNAPRKAKRAGEHPARR